MRESLLYGAGEGAGVGQRFVLLWLPVAVHASRKQSGVSVGMAFSALDFIPKEEYLYF